jgi:hypothetical protein
MYQRRSALGGRNLQGSVHQAGALWSPNDWNLSGYYQTSYLEGTSQFTTDANSQFLALSRQFNEKIYSRVSWRRREDNSHTLDYTTQDLNMDFNWRIAPYLVFTQKIGRGMRSDHLSTAEARSWLLISTVRSNPVRTLSMDLKRIDRWVSVNAGTGFSTFNNTELNTRWSVLPLVAYNSQVLYQIRDGSDWMARNQVSWTPIPGGNMGISLNVVDYRDTRIDIKQKSAGARINWKVRSNARVEMGAEIVNVWQRGEQNKPHNLYFRVSANF